jgi:hypothetical protein
LSSPKKKRIYTNKAEDKVEGQEVNQERKRKTHKHPLRDLARPPNTTQIPVVEDVHDAVGGCQRRILQPVIRVG